MKTYSHKETHTFELSISSTGVKANNMILYEHPQNPSHKIILTSHQVQNLFLEWPIYCLDGLCMSYHSRSRATDQQTQFPYLSSNNKTNKNCLFKYTTWQKPAADVDQKEKFWSQSLFSASQSHPVSPA
jgi:hypothetical protein